MSLSVKIVIVILMTIALARQLVLDHLADAMMARSKIKLKVNYYALAWSCLVDGSIAGFSSVMIGVLYPDNPIAWSITILISCVIAAARINRQVRRWNKMILAQPKCEIKASADYE